MWNFLPQNFTKYCSSYKERGVLTCYVSDTLTYTLLQITQVNFQNLSVSTKNIAVFVHIACPNFVRTVESSQVMRDKESFMSFRCGLLIVLYRHIFFPQVAIHNTIQVTLFHMSMFTRQFSKDISVESIEIVSNLHLRSFFFVILRSV
jgi:hypothetical protein